MPSPFPGMDPYIESPELWSDFHNNLASEIQAHLNRHIQPRYFARLTPYVTYEVVEIGQAHGIRPDVGVWHLAPAPATSTTSTSTISAAPVESLVALEIPLRLHRVEIRTTAQQLVTVIEILSPVNKRPGHQAHLAYHRKRRNLLHSEAHLLEIDLLCGGERPPLERPVPPAVYYVVLRRAERRPRVDVWPIQLWDRLPILPVPLLAPDPDVALDLGAAVASVYERGAYAQQIDYRQSPPPPPLGNAEAEWLAELLNHG
jgi:Protein of unknown function (DUF4058)